MEGALQERSIIADRADRIPAGYPDRDAIYQRCGDYSIYTQRVDINRGKCRTHGDPNACNHYKSDRCIDKKAESEVEQHEV